MMGDGTLIMWLPPPAGFVARRDEYYREQSLTSIFRTVNARQSILRIKAIK